MKGVVYLGESEVEVREFPTPEPGPGEVLVEMKVAGLCGSDLHKYRESREWAAQRQGMIAGHEPAGIVAALGAGVENVAVGDRVCVYHSLGCGHCADCLAGEPVFCAHEGAFGRTRDGCHADYMLAPARFCLPLPDELSFAAGAQLACTAGTAFAAVQKVRIRAGEAFVVFGLGPVGLTVLLLGQALGFRCLGFEVNEYRLDLARRLTEGTIASPTEAAPVETIREFTDGVGAPAIIECSGNATARSQTVLAAANRGQIVIVGAGDSDMNLEPLTVIHHALTIQGNAVYSLRQYFQAEEFYRRHQVPLDDLVTHRYRIEDAPAAFATFGTGNTGKVVFDWEA